MSRKELGAALLRAPRDTTLKPRGIIFFSIICFAVAIATIARSGQNDYVPKSGQPGKDIVWVGNPSVMVEKMLDMAAVTPRDYVVDLGSGDGRNVIAAAKRGARAHGIEYNPDLVDFSKRLAAKEGVSDKATFERGDLFLADFSQATVVFLFLTPEMNIRLRPKLLSLKPGARVVANTFAIGDWNPDQMLSDVSGCERFCTARLWIVPAKVNGTWRIPQGEFTLRQAYQSFSGTFKNGVAVLPVTGRLHGDEINFYSRKTQYTARVDGKIMEGFARTAGVDSKFRAVLADK